MSSRTAALVEVADQVSRKYIMDDVSSITYEPRITSSIASELTVLTRTNMKKFYDGANLLEWIWDDEKKQNEFLNLKSHFFVSTNVGVDGFLCFRFMIDSKRPVQYIWELHATVPGKGVGSRLLLEATRFCKSNTCVTFQVLTCFTANVGALKFYKREGFSIDSSSPKGGPYVILSRTI